MLPKAGPKVNEVVTRWTGHCGVPLPGHPGAGPGTRRRDPERQRTCGGGPEGGIDVRDEVRAGRPPIPAGERTATVVPAGDQHRKDGPPSPGDRRAGSRRQACPCRTRLSRLSSVQGTGNPLQCLPAPVAALQSGPEPRRDAVLGPEALPLRQPCVRMRGACRGDRDVAIWPVMQRVTDAAVLHSVFGSRPRRIPHGEFQTCSEPPCRRTVPPDSHKDSVQRLSSPRH